ncbi:MAG: manganese efflux pump MntP family protein [Anaerofustis sp.]
MGFIQLLLIGIGLSMDAFAVSVCKGLKMRTVDKKYMLLISIFFGAFQALMPVIGWILGKQFEQYITSYDHWIAFVLLAFVGVKMIMEAIKPDEEDDCEVCAVSYDIKEVLVLAVATSIDALAVGITFAFLSVNILSAVLIIGITTFLLSMLGVIVGNRFGIRYKSKAELAGGIVLVLIGVKILLEHLNIL